MYESYFGCLQTYTYTYTIEWRPMYQNSGIQKNTLYVDEDNEELGFP